MDDVWVVWTGEILWSEAARCRVSSTAGIYLWPERKSCLKHYSTLDQFKKNHSIILIAIVTVILFMAQNSTVAESPYICLRISIVYGELVAYTFGGWGGSVRSSLHTKPSAREEVPTSSSSRRTCDLKQPGLPCTTGDGKSAINSMTITWIPMAACRMAATRHHVLA